MDGDVDAAIEYLIAEQGTGEISAETSSSSCQPETSYGNDRSVFILMK